MRACMAMNSLVSQVVQTVTHMWLSGRIGASAAAIYHVCDGYGIQISNGNVKLCFYKIAMKYAVTELYK
eukprot:10600088-Karenia_brevis.AAC.1